MTRLAAIRLSVSCLLLLIAADSCDGCQSCGNAKPALATLLELKGGQAQGERPETGDYWQAADLGREFRSGDSLRTDPNASAKLRLADGSLLVVQPASLIRFGRDADGQPRIDLVTGEAIITAGANELRFHTHVGLAMLRPGSSVQLARKGSGMQVSLHVGDASFRRLNGESLLLARGESLLLEVGEAQISERQPQPPAAGALRAQVHGPGVQQQTPGAPGWLPLAVGEHAVVDDTELTLPASTGVTLSQDDDRVQLFGAGAYRVGGAELVRASRGKLQLQARSHNITVAVPGGWIVASAANGGSDAELSVGEQEGLLQVTRGAVNWRTPEGERTVPPGEPLRWQFEATNAVAHEPAADSGEQQSLGRASLELRAGESFVVHSPEVPVVVEFEFTHVCKGRGIVELNNQTHARGDGRAKLALGTDARSYTVRCVDAHGGAGKLVARGGARVLQDAGTRNLPPRAPTSAVDADGRSYTIYYQNQLPEIHVRWPDPPSASGYQLDVDGQAMSLTAPEHTFASGSLRDGVHRLTFAAVERRSRTANIEIHFDNTATTASLTAPADRAFSAGDTVEIEGVALAAWKVSVDGGAIEKLAEDRFHGSVVTTPAHPDVAVRLDHPRLGTHYYLRRAAESP